jgi:hypothetical protein
MLENEMTERMKKSKYPSRQNIEGRSGMFIPCKFYPKCNTFFKKVIDYKVHDQYHKDIAKETS